MLSTAASNLKLPATPGREERLLDSNQLLTDPTSIFPVSPGLFLRKLKDIVLQKSHVAVEVWEILEYTKLNGFLYCRTSQSLRRLKQWFSN